MDYKEKYEMALEGIQEILSSGQESIKMSLLQQRLQGVFPELKQLKDEMIRIGLLANFRRFDGDYLWGTNTYVLVKDIIAWLEKQDNNKHIKLSEENDTDEDYKIGKWFTGLIPCWINAPSTLQPLHSKHGKNVIAIHLKEGGYKCCCIDDEKPVVFTVAEDTSFVEGWHNRETSNWSEEDELRIEKLLGWLDTLVNYIHHDALVSLDLRRERIQKVEQLKIWFKSLKDKCKGASEHNKIQFEKQSKLKPFDYENANIPQKDFALIEPRFREGDVITSSNNRKLKYLIKKVGVKNELGKLDYVVECIADNEFKGKIYNMSIDKVDSWGVLVEDSSVEDKKIEPKFKPKFKVGDWISCYYSNCKVKEINDEEYIAEDADGNKISILFENEKFYHLWTIKDAKDGDVLVASHQKGHETGEQIFIFKCINNRGYVDNCIEYYCHVYNREFYVNKTGYGYMGTTSSPLCPASKEQRGFLFQKMKEAGYIWNEKELKLEKA